MSATPAQIANGAFVNSSESHQWKASVESRCALWCHWHIRTLQQLSASSRNSIHGTYAASKVCTLVYLGSWLDQSITQCTTLSAQTVSSTKHRHMAAPYVATPWHRLCCLKALDAAALAINARGTQCALRCPRMSSTCPPGHSTCL